MEDSECMRGYNLEGDDLQLRIPLQECSLYADKHSYYKLRLESSTNLPHSTLEMGGSV